MEKKIVLPEERTVGQFKCSCGGTLYLCVVFFFFALPLVIFTSTSYEVPPKFNIELTKLKSLFKKRMIDVKTSNQAGFCCKPVCMIKVNRQNGS